MARYPARGGPGEGRSQERKAATGVGLLLFALAFLLAACGGGNPEPAPTVTATAAVAVRATERPVLSDSTPSATSVPPARPSATPASEEMVVGGMARPEDSDWASAKRGDPLGVLLGAMLHRSLLDPAEPDEQIADEWTVSGSRITFRLKDSIAWSDGTAIRAADIADIVQQAAEAGEISGIGRVTTSGQEVTVTAEGDVCPLLMRVGALPIVDVREFPPVRSSREVVVREMGDGVWELVAEGSRVTYRAFEDENALREAWASGELDAVIGASRLTLGPLEGGRRVSPERTSPMTAALLFQLGDERVQSHAVREALALATERGALFEDAYGIGAPALSTALLPPGHWASPEIGWRHDAEAAVDLLEESGWSDRDGDGMRENGAGEPLSITLMVPLSPDEQWEALGHGLVAQWRAVGIDARAQFVESYPLEERLHDGRWQVALVAYRLDPDPDQRALWTAPAPDDLVGQDLSVTGYDHPEVTTLLNRAVRVPGCDLTGRATLYQQAWEQIAEDKPLLPLFPLPSDMIVK